MKMTFEFFIKQKTWFNFVSFLTEQTLSHDAHFTSCLFFVNSLLLYLKKIFKPGHFLAKINPILNTLSWNSSTEVVAV